MQATSRKLVIVGASAAGLRCACRAARLAPDREVTVVEQRPVFSYAACGLPYVLSGDLPNPGVLGRTADGAVRDVEFFDRVKGVTVLAGWTARGVDRDRRRLRIQRGADSRELEWDDLVLATGARPRRLAGQPEHPRIRGLHTLEDLPPLKEALEKGTLEHAVVVGAGLLGCELAEALRALWGIRVTMVEAAASPLAGVADVEVGRLVAAELAKNEVELLCNAPVDRFLADGDELAVEAAGRTIAADAILVAAGLEPAVELAREAGVRLGASGALEVDERLATTVPGIWAAGDCAEVRHAVTGRAAYLPLGSLANRQGRTLANVLAGLEDRFPPVAGAVALKVFELNVAAAGVTRAAALARGLAARSVWLSSADTAHYWPEAKELAVHLVYETGSLRVLGVQAAGSGEAVKRVDVATQFLLRSATLRELAQLEHAYAPPYAPAVDPLAVAAMVAENLEQGPDALAPTASLEGRRLLDVRHDEERQARPCPGQDVLAIPLESLRARLAPSQPSPSGGGELGLADLAHGHWVVVCERGGRSAEAARWLRARGVCADYLGGGLRWRTAASDS